MATAVAFEVDQSLFSSGHCATGMIPQAINAFGSKKIQNIPSRQFESKSPALLTDDFSDESDEQTIYVRSDSETSRWFFFQGSPLSPIPRPQTIV